MKKTTDSSSDSSVDNSWITNENGTLPGDEDDTEIIMKGFTPIDDNEEYV